MIEGYLTLSIALTGLGTSLVTLTTVIIGLHRGVKRDGRIENITLSLDGRLTELKSLIAKSSHAEGMLEGAANEKANPS